jgi:hypothetical protein
MCYALQVVDPSLYQEGKNLLVRIVVMLTKMCFVRSKIEHEHEHVYVLRSRQYAGTAAEGYAANLV